MNYHGSALQLLITKILESTKLAAFVLFLVSSISTSNLAFANSSYHMLLKPLPILVSQHQFQKLSRQQKETLRKVLVAQSWAARNSEAAGVVGEVALNVLSAIRGDAQLICSGSRGVDSVSRERLLTASECSAAKKLLASRILRADLLGLTFFPRSCTELNSKYPNSGTSMTIIYKDGASDSGEPQDCSPIQSLIVSEFRYILRREPSDQEIQSMMTSLGAASESRPTAELIRTAIARSVEFDDVVRSMYRSFGLNEPSQTEIETARSEAFNQGTEAFGYRLNRSLGSRFTRGYNLLVSWIKGTLNRTPDEQELTNISRYVSANLNQSQSEIASPETQSKQVQQNLLNQIASSDDEALAGVISYVLDDNDEQIKAEVQEASRLFLAREPTESEMNTWIVRIRDQGLSIDAMRVAIYNSEEAASIAQNRTANSLNHSVAQMVMSHVASYADALDEAENAFMDAINTLLLGED